LTDTPTPHIDTVYALTKLLAKTLDEDKTPSARGRPPRDLSRLRAATRPIAPWAMHAPA